MPPHLPLASFGNLLGLDAIIILAVQLTIFVGGAAVVFLLVRRSVGWQPRGTTEERLQKLDALRRTGKITEAEHQEGRRRILLGL